MRKLLVVILCCLAVAAVRCNRKPKPKAVAPAKSDSAMLAERVKELEFNFPAEALAPMSEPEVVAYANALPGVVAALKKAGFKAPYLEGAPREVFANIGMLADSMKATPGFNAVLERSGLSDTDFRTRFMQTWAAGYALSLDSSLAAFHDQDATRCPARGTCSRCSSPGSRPAREYRRKTRNWFGMPRRARPAPAGHL